MNKNKMEELLAASKLGALLSKKEDNDKKNKICLIAGIVVAVAAVAGIAYALYKHFTPKYEDDFDEYSEDEFEDDFFEE